MGRPTPETVALRARIVAMLPATTAQIRRTLGTALAPTRTALLTLAGQGRIRREAGIWRTLAVDPQDAERKRRTLMVAGDGERHETCERYSECGFGWAYQHGDDPCCCPMGCPAYVPRDMADEREFAMRGEGWQA